jgi:hypothetical protein
MKNHTKKDVTPSLTFKPRAMEIEKAPEEERAMTDSRNLPRSASTANVRRSKKEAREESRK